MRDLLLRIRASVPQFLSWIAELHIANQGSARQVSTIASPKLSSYWPAEVLECSRAVVASVVPFPPVAEYGLPEFESMAAMPMGGITFGDMYFLHEEHATESVHFHELVHVVQWRELGLEGFLLTYALGVAQNGYRQSPFERVAYEAQREFDASRPVSSLLVSVQAHARRQYQETKDLFGQHGLRMDAR